MSKKVFALLSALVIIAMVLAGCARVTPEATEAPPVITEAPQVEPTPEPTDAPTIVPTEVAMTELVVWADNLRSPIIDELGNQFASEFGVQLNVQLMGFGDIRDQLAVAGPAGEGPDIIIGAHDWLGQLVVNGLVAPIDLGDKADQFLEAALTAFTYEGELYGVPYATENIAFFCNPDVVASPPTTWDEVMDLAEELEAASGGETTAWTIQTSDPYHYFPVMNSFGGYVFGLREEGYDPSDVGLDSEGAVEAAQWLEEMATVGHLQADIDYDVMHTLFTQGNVACIGTGPWALELIRGSGVQYTINPFPAGDEGRGRPFLGVQGFMVSAFSENQLLAQTILQEIFATDEFMQAMFDADPRPPAFLPVREVVDDPDLAAFAEAGDQGLPMPAIPEMSSVWEAWGNAISLVISRQQSATDAFSTAAEQVRTLIGQ